MRVPERSAPRLARSAALRSLAVLGTGGVDIAARAMSLRPVLTPDLIACRLALASTRERVTLPDLVSLLPGTLSADLQGIDLTARALDRGRDIHGRARSLESEA